MIDAHRRRGYLWVKSNASVHCDKSRNLINISRRVLAVSSVGERELELSLDGRFESLFQFNDVL